MKLKICGMKYPDNIKEVAALQPDFMGFIFYPKSSRYVGEDFEIPSISSSIQRVGVFVNAKPSEVMEKVVKYDLDYVQLHGDESPEECQEMAKQIKVIKAFGIDKSFDFQQTKKYESFCDFFIFDTKTKDYGGSGKIFDWKLLEKYEGKLPYLLSGGISLEALSSLKEENIFGIDVNSKFEIRPGEKNIELLTELTNVLNYKK